MLNSPDVQFKASCPGNTTPQAPDGSGASGASMCGYSLTNTAAAVRYVKFYDKSTAPTIGTDVPKRTIAIPAGTRAAVEFIRGVKFSNGMWVSVTVLAADTDTTAPTAGDVLLTVDYQ